jgi:Tfp pilus assembly protein PilX
MYPGKTAMPRLRRKNDSGQEGSIVIVALVLLVLVTLMGVSITQITSVEMRVAANERDYKRVFYLAEAAVMEALQRLENAEPVDLKTSTTTLAWLHDGDTNLENRENMKNTDSISAASTFDPDTYFAVTARGITGGSSLSMTTSSRLYSFDAYGYSEKQRGRAHIVGGYKRRF